VPVAVPGVDLDLLVKPVVLARSGMMEAAVPARLVQSAEQPRPLAVQRLQQGKRLVDGLRIAVGSEDPAVLLVGRNSGQGVCSFFVATFEVFSRTVTVRTLPQLERHIFKLALPTCRSRTSASSHPWNPASPGVTVAMTYPEALSQIVPMSVQVTSFLENAA
jgi:hypothetical protein